MNSSNMTLGSPRRDTPHRAIPGSNADGRYPSGPPSDHLLSLNRSASRPTEVRFAVFPPFSEAARPLDVASKSRYHRADRVNRTDAEVITGGEHRRYGAHRESLVKLSPEQLDTLRSKYRLSPRERQILELLFEGLPTNQDIADRLGTTPGAVQAGVRTLCAKTAARSRHELLLICLEEAQAGASEATRRAELDNASKLLAYARELERRISRLEGRKD